MRQGGHHHSIIGKKKWHVGRQENLDRVAKDERAAAGETLAKQSKERTAEGEARLRALRAQLGLAPIISAAVDDVEDIPVSGRAKDASRGDVKPHPEYEAEQRGKEARARKAAGVPDWKFSDMVTAPAWYMRGGGAAGGIAPEKVKREEAIKSTLDPLAAMQEYLNADRAAAEVFEEEEEEEAIVPVAVALPIVAQPEPPPPQADNARRASSRDDEHRHHRRKRSRDASRYDDDDDRSGGSDEDRRARRHRRHSSSHRRSRSRSRSEERDRSHRRSRRHDEHRHRHQRDRHSEGEARTDERFLDASDDEPRGRQALPAHE